MMSARVCVCCASAALLLGSIAAPADEVYQDLNESLDPAPFYWGAPSGNIGWYWTPATDVLLSGVQTRLASGFANINNDYTFTTTLYTDRPAAGGVELGSFTWNGVTPVDGDWLGGSFPAALDLTGGTEYFLGMSGWEQGLTGTGGSGVNWIDPPDQVGAEDLGAGSGYTGVDFDTQMNTTGDVANVDSPILRFIAVPEPGTLALLAVAGLAIVRRRGD